MSDTKTLIKKIIEGIQEKKVKILLSPTLPASKKPSANILSSAREILPAK